MRIQTLATKVKEVFTPPNELAALRAENERLHAQLAAAEQAATNSRRRVDEIQTELARLRIELDQANANAAKAALNLMAYEKQLGEVLTQLEKKVGRIADLEAVVEECQRRNQSVKQMAKDRLAGIEKSVVDALNALRQLDSELVV